MADKVQNVVVNFKFNTAELEKATQLTNRANDASNKLQQSAANAGKKLSDSFRQPIQSIGAMQQQLGRLKTQIEVATDPKRVQQLSAQYKILKTQLDLATKAAFDNSKELKRIGQEGAKTASILGQVGTALSAAFSAAVVRSVVDTALNLAKLSGNVEGVERAFNRAFGNAPFLLEELRQATAGTVNDFELMQRTLQATNLGLAVEPLPKLFAFAAARAQQTGESVDHLVESIVRGIGLKSVLRLDNLGISASRLKDELGGVSVKAASVAQLTEVMGRIVEQELKKMGGLARTAATDVAKISVAFHDLQVAAGDAFVDINKWFENKTGLPGFIRSLEFALQGATATFKALQESVSSGSIVTPMEMLLKIEQQRQALEAAGAVKRKAESEEFSKDAVKRADFVQQEINSRVQIINTYREEIRNNQERLKLLEKSTRGGMALIDQAKLYNRENELVNHTIGDTNILNTKGKNLRTELVNLAGQEIPKIEATNTALKSNIKIVDETIKLLVNYLNTVGKVTEEEVEQKGIIEAKKEQIEEIQDAIDKTRNSAELSGTAFKKGFNIGTLITQLEVAQAELAELLSGVPPEINIKLNLKSNLALPKGGATKDFEKQIGLDQEGGEVQIPITVVPEAPETIPMDFWDNMADALNEGRQELMDDGLQIFSDQLISFEEAEVASLQNRLNNLRNFYDEQQILAGDNERAKQELRLKEERETAALQKKIAQKEKEARRFSVIIDTAAGIVRAFATSPTIAQGIINAALVAAQGASQLAIINRTQPRFKDGVINLKGPGTGTSDSIQARLSKGESVMTARETQNSMGILKDIRAKKLDDNVLKDLKLSSGGVTYNGMDDSRIVKEIQELKASQPNIIEQSGKLYKQYSKGKNYKIKSRISAMGY